jgi:hypothetical protein
MGDVPFYLDIELEVRELFAAKMAEFAAFCAQKWTMTADEARDLIKPIEDPAKYVEGYNAAMTDGVAGAIDFWLEEELGYSR